VGHTGRAALVCNWVEGRTKTIYERETAIYEGKEEEEERLRRREGTRGSKRSKVNFKT